MLTDNRKLKAIDIQNLIEEDLDRYPSHVAVGGEWSKLTVQLAWRSYGKISLSELILKYGKIAVANLKNFSF